MYQGQHDFSLITNFHDLSASEFNSMTSMTITNLKIYKGFDRE